MLPELPVEIWLRIVSYLSPKEFIRLSPLNRFFRELVRNYRYENFVLRCFTDDMMDMLKNARIPSIAQRIHSLEIQLQEFVWLVDFDKAYPPHWWPTTLKSPLTFLRSRMTNRAIQKDSKPMMSRTVTQITNYLLTAAPEMVNLYSCHFGFLPQGALEPYIPFLRNFWSMIAPSVRRLTIEALGSQMHLLSSVFCHVHHLEHLTISVVQQEFPQTVWDAGPAWDVSLASFLNNASETLQSLTLASSPHSVTPEYRSFFNQLTRFKNLERFNLDFFLDGIVTSGKHHFYQEQMEAR
ncbi:hypothetical protein ONZ45_g7329 [Pleurotus djamor]|nr:hypothetical protein ONZ45_g7329 [Pleurotus djamor]